MLYEHTDSEVVHHVRKRLKSVDFNRRNLLFVPRLSRSKKAIEYQWLGGAFDRERTWVFPWMDSYNLQMCQVNVRLHFKSRLGRYLILPALTQALQHGNPDAGRS